MHVGFVVPLQCTIASRYALAIAHCELFATRSAFYWPLFRLSTCGHFQRALEIVSESALSNPICVYAHNSASMASKCPSKRWFSQFASLPLSLSLCDHSTRREPLAAGNAGVESAALHSRRPVRAHNLACRNEGAVPSVVIDKRRAIWRSCMRYSNECNSHRTFLSVRHSFASNYCAL